MLSHSLGDEVDGLVDSTERGDVDGLLTHNTSSANSGGVLSGTSLHNGIDENLEGISSSEQVDDLEGVSDDSDGLHLLAGVSSVELEGTNKSLNDGAECFSELL